MKCPNCGVEYTENVAFCTSCGTPMTAQETPAAEPAQSQNSLNNALDQLMDKLTPVAVKIKKFLSVKKNLMIVGGALVALLLLIIVVSAVSSANTGFETYDNYYSISANEDDEVVILNKGQVIETSIEYTGSVSSSHSHDGKTYAFLSAGNLAYVKGGKVVEVEEEVTGFKLSADGKAIVYTADEGTSLYLYPIGGTAAKIEDDVSIRSFAVSPNGKSVLYSVYDDDEEGKTPVYFYNGKDSVKIASNGSALGVSDGGKYIYYSSVNDKGENIAYFYNKNKEEKTKLETLARIQFNSDLSQALIVNDEYKTYISTKGGEAEKVSSKSVYLITSKAFTVNNVSAVDNFYGKLFLSADNDIYRIEKNADKTIKLVSNCYGVSVDESYETIHYTDDDGDFFVTKVSYGEKAKDKAKMIAEEVYDFVITSDGKLAYYRSEEDVFVINAKGSGKAKRVSSDDVNSYLSIDDKDVVYFSCDEDLHAVKGKKASTVVLEEYLERYLRGGYMYAIDEDSYYYLKGTKAEKLFDYSDLILGW